MFYRKYRIPLCAALAALIVYVATSSWGGSFTSIGELSQLLGLTGEPPANKPLVWFTIITSRLLGPRFAPAGMSLASAICASLVVGLLARSVQLLVNASNSKREESSWRNLLPIVLACVGCGLQFTFWNNATSVATEMLEILPMAAMLCCLLEFRAEKNTQWLGSAAFFWGVSTAETPMMALAVPLILISLLMTLKFSILNVPLWKRILVFAAGGLALGLIPPMINGLTPLAPWGFGDAWKMWFVASKSDVGTCYHLWGGSRALALALLSFYLLPTLPCLIFQRAEDAKRRGNRKPLEYNVKIIAHGLLFVGCLWLALEPNIGPGKLLAKQFGLPETLLSFSYLDALGLGCLSGNLLAFFRASTTRQTTRNLTQTEGLIRNQWTLVVMTLVMVFFGTILLFKNAPDVWTNNRHKLKEFGQTALACLPPEGGIVLSDDLQKLAAFQSASFEKSGGQTRLAVWTKLLPMPDYRAFLERKKALGWVDSNSRHPLEPIETVGLLDRIIRANRIFYLNPSFGLLFENYYLEPVGAVYELKKREQILHAESEISADTLSKNQYLWDAISRDKLAPLIRNNTRNSASLFQVFEKLFQSLKVSHHEPWQGELLAEWYSVALNHWGVVLQRQQKLEPASRSFEEALRLKTNNVSARLNLETGSNLISGKTTSFDGMNKALSTFTSNTRLLDLILDHGGPLDHPILSCLIGEQFRKAGLPIQAVREFERVRTLVPSSPAPYCDLAALYSGLNLPDKVLEAVARARALDNNLQKNTNLDLNLTLLEARAWAAKSNTVRATAVCNSAITRYANDPRTRLLVTLALINMGNLSEAQSLVEKRLESNPEDTSAKLLQANIFLASHQPTNAIRVADTILATTNMPEAILTRAMAYQAITNLSAAEADYLLLEKHKFIAWWMHCGLAQIALQRHDTNLAIRHLETSLTNTPAQSLQWLQSRAQLDALKPQVAKPE